MLFADTVLSLSGLVSYWRCNEGSGTVVNDFSANNYDLSAVGSPGWGSSLLGNGQAGASVTLAGSDAYEAPTDPIYALGDTFSIIAAFNATNVSSPHGLVAKGTGYWYFRVNSGKLELLKQEVLGVIVGATTLSTGVTYLGGVTKNGASNHLYLNGVDDTGVVNNAVMVNNNLSPIAIGRSSNAAEFFTGSLAECAVWDRELTAGEMATLYTAFTSGQSGVSVRMPVGGL